MDDPNQLSAPPAFVDLFIEPGSNRPMASREHIFGRYELCEDLATVLTDYAGKLQDDPDMTRRTVLEQCYLGLLTPGSTITAAEAPWVVGRLAELLDWRFRPEDLPQVSEAQDDAAP